MYTIIKIISSKTNTNSESYYLLNYNKIIGVLHCNLDEANKMIKMLNSHPLVDEN